MGNAKDQCSMLNAHAQRHEGSVPLGIEHWASGSPDVRLPDCPETEPFCSGKRGRLGFAKARRRRRAVFLRFSGLFSAGHAGITPAELPPEPLHRRYTPLLGSRLY